MSKKETTTKPEMTTIKIPSEILAIFAQSASLAVSRPPQDVDTTMDARAAAIGALGGVLSDVVTGVQVLGQMLVDAPNFTDTQKLMTVQISEKLSVK